MNKTNVERALVILAADLAQDHSGRRGRRRRAQRAVMPGEFPPGVHPDDWEPDDEVERGPIVADPAPPRPRW